ncbi:unnamed protein product, partial [Amoebophrya sp. A120]
KNQNGPGVASESNGPSNAVIQQRILESTTKLVEKLMNEFVRCNKSTGASTSGDGFLPATQTKLATDPRCVCNIVYALGKILMKHGKSRRHEEMSHEFGAVQFRKDKENHSSDVVGADVGGSVRDSSSCSDQNRRLKLFSQVQQLLNFFHANIFEKVGNYIKREDATGSGLARSCVEEQEQMKRQQHQREDNTTIPSSEIWSQKKRTRDEKLEIQELRRTKSDGSVFFSEVGLAQLLNGYAHLYGFFAAGSLSPGEGSTSGDGASPGGTGGTGTGIIPPPHLSLLSEVKSRLQMDEMMPKAMSLILSSLAKIYTIEENLMNDRGLLSTEQTSGRLVDPDKDDAEPREQTSNDGSRSTTPTCSTNHASTATRHQSISFHT